MNRKTEKVITVIVYVLVVLALVAVVGLVYKFTNGFNEDFKTFYIEYDGERILTSENKMIFEPNKTHTFQVKYTFDSGKAEPKDYSVKIIPNVTRDFEYTVDGERYLYSKADDLTGAFGVKKEQTEFFIPLPLDFNLRDVLENLHGGKSVEVSDEAEINNPYPYMLVVSSYNGKVVYNIVFNILGANGTSITLSPSEIIF